MTKRRSLILFFLFLVYAILVWFCAFVFFPDSAVLVGTILTVCGLTLLLVYILVARLTLKLTSPPAATGGGQEAGPPSSRQNPDRDYDTEPIASLIAEANDRLSKSPTLASVKVRPMVTNLPLYLLLGAEGSGKTSAFLASEMDPELLAGEAYRDSAVAPTRLLNLWFASGCVVAEPSGRFFSEDPERLQRLVEMLLGAHGASQFARLMSRKSQAQQMKGVVLCCPIDTFLGVPDAGRLAALVRKLQDRLRAIGETLGVGFPVYLVFTKCDALPYFGEYFTRLVDSEDEQVLGCTLPVGMASDQMYTAAQTARISDYFNRLYSSLAEQRITFLRRETDPAKKGAIYEFPRELKRIRSTLVPFLVDVFRPNPLQPGPLLRGFYFTGTRKVPALEGAARNKSSSTSLFKVGEATRLFRAEDLQKTPVPRPPAEEMALATVWSFTAALFRQIIVADRDQLSVVQTDRRLDLYRRIVFGSVAFVCLLLILVFGRSWWGNRDLLHQAQAAAAGVMPLAHATDTPSSENLTQMENLRSVLKDVGENHYHGAPWRLGFGLYAGDPIYEALRNVYFERFREYFLAKNIRGIEERLGGLPRAQSPNFDYKSVYNDLKGYRTVTVYSEPNCPVDDELTQWVTGSWRGSELAERQFRFYIDELRAKRNPYPDWKSQAPVVTTARDYLANYTGIDPLYQAIIAAVNEQMSSTARLSDYTQRAPDTLVLAAGSEVPSAFTVKGFDLVEKKIANAGGDNNGEPCVLGFGRTLTGLVQSSDTSRQLTNKYIREYIERWKKFLAVTSVQTYRNRADAARKLDLLGSNGSPLLAVLAMVAENTQFTSNGSTTAPSVVARVEAQGKRNLLDRLRGRAPAAVKDVIPKVQPDEVLSSQKIAQVFQPARTLFQSPNRNRLVDDVNTKYVAALGDLQSAMSALAQVSNPDENLELNNRANEKAQAGIRAAKELSLKFDSNPEVVGDSVSAFLLEPITQAQKFIVTDPTKPALGKLEAGLRDLCGKLHPILRKYPFSSLSDQQVELSELKSIFSPGGAFWNFKRQYAEKLLELRGRQWFVKADSEIPLNEGFIRFFNRMARVSYALFPPDQDSPQAQFTMSLPAAAGYQSISGVVDGEDVGIAPKQYSWPGQQPGVKLRVVLPGTTIAFARYEGLWGLFRWLQSAEERQAGSPTFGFVYQSRATQGSQPQTILENGDPIRIQVTEFPGKIDTVFDKDFFTGIECPAKAGQ